MIEQIILLISTLPYPIDKKDYSTTLARLYFEVAQKSIANDPEKRVLTNDLLDTIILSIGDTDERWYAELYEKWKNAVSISHFFVGEFYEVITAANYCRWHNYLSAHDHLWIRLLEGYIHLGETLPFFTRKAIYELLWLQLRPSHRSYKPKGSLVGLEDKIRHYFGQLNELDSPQEFDEAVSLLSIVKSSLIFNKVEITEEELKFWLNELDQSLKKSISTANSITDKCYLLEILGFYQINLNEGFAEVESFNKGVKYFKEIIPLLDEANLYAVSRLSGRINSIIQILIKVENPESEKFINILETFSIELQPHVQKREGKHKAAKTFVDRGITYLDRQEPKYKLKALSYFHKAKDLWQQEETLEGHYLALINISQLYLSVSMNFAAKYYALGALWICINSNKPTLIKRIYEAFAFLIHADYRQGAWISLIYDLQWFLNSRSDFSTKEWDVESDSLLRNTMLDVAYVFHTIPKLNYQLDGFLIHIKDRLGWFYSEFHLQSWVQELDNKIKTNDDVRTFVERELIDTPLNDVGRERTVSWQAFGSEWKVSFSNTAEVNAIAEEFCSVLQVIIVELALGNTELFLLKSEIQLFLKVGEGFKAPKQLPTNEKYEWEIVVPVLTSTTGKEVQQLYTSITAAIISILNEVSLLPESDFMDIVHCLFRDSNLSNKYFAVHSYQRMYREFFDASLFDESQRHNFENIQHPFNLPAENTIIKWASSLSPTYNEEESKKRIKERYIRTENKTKFVLNEWKQNPEFINKLNKLREEGWLDWQILHAITNYLISIRVNSLVANKTFKNAVEEQKYADEQIKDLMFNDDELKYKDVPLNIFEDNLFKMILRQTPISTLKSLSLEYKSKIPNFDSVKNFLIHRYHFNIDDTPEVNPLHNLK